MATTYELMDTVSANLIGTYESEAAALAVIRSAILQHGQSAVDGVALGYEDDDGNGAMIAEGADLATRALDTHSTKAS